MKYPRTYHMPFSPGATKDDKKLKDGWFEYYRGKKVVITEKLDGENTCLCQRGVFARSHAAETRSPWSVNLWGGNGLYWGVKDLIDDDLLVFGENLYGEHSIHYNKLKNYFHIFACYNETDKEWWSWYDVTFVAKVLGIPTVPVLWKGFAESEDQIHEIITQLMNMPSAYGDVKEGVVMRIVDEIPEEDFPNYVCKFVRANHVQTNEHWTKNWKRAELITEQDG